ncbi:MAG: hypothetical protein V4489_06360 [Chlamydiota bacterium]
MDLSFPLDISTVEKEGALHCSKWVKHAVLLDREEMESLWEVLASCIIISPIQKVSKEKWQVSKEHFFTWYEKYLSWLRLEDDFPPPDLRKEFTLMLSTFVEAFYAVSLSSDQFLIKARCPVIQIQIYHCFISKFDRKIYPMAMNADSFTYGLQISYPQIYEEPHVGKFKKMLLEKDFPNTILYKQIVQWLRNHTKPATFFLGDKEEVAPFRVGKKEKDGIGDHKRFKKTLAGFV